MKELERINILIVDDRPENLISLEALLEDFDANIIKAASGEEALGLTLEYDFALILLDVQMPDMDGFETAELLRGSAKTNHVPIIFVTAINKDQYHIFKGYESGAVDYLFKPLNADVLKNKVNIFLNIQKHKIALKNKNNALKKANRIIIEQQKSIIEEERLKVILQMSGATAHELNQPLTVLLGHLEMLENFYGEDNEINEHLIKVKNSGERISAIVKKIQHIQTSRTLSDENNRYAIAFDKKIKILSVEDQNDDFIIIKEALASNEKFNLLKAENIKKAVLSLKKESFDIILLDYILPDGTAFDFISELKRSEIEIPVAVVTGRGDELIASQLIQAGAFDYLPKQSINDSSLIRVISNTTEKANLAKEIKKAHAAISRMATKDELTGLFNRRYFNETLATEFERSKRYNFEMILLIADLDFFKRVNDTHGHVAGDMVLTAVGQQFKKSLRKNDIACRFGGEEFAIVLPHTNKKEGYGVAQQQMEKIAEMEFNFNSVSFSITISTGAASSNDTDSFEKMLTYADKALYQAKEEGRNRVVLYKDESNNGSAA